MNNFTMKNFRGTGLFLRFWFPLDCTHASKWDCKILWEEGRRNPGQAESGLIGSKGYLKGAGGEKGFLESLRHSS